MVQRAPDARLIAIVGPASGEVFPLSNEQITLGRDPTNAICIPDQGLSRRHCALTPGAEGWEVRDLGSSNGTFINGVQMPQYILTEGDHIAVGHSMLLFTSGGHVSSGADSADSPETSVVTVDEVPRPATARLATSRIEHGLQALLAMSAMLHSVRDEEALHHEVLQVVRELTKAHRAVMIDIDSLSARHDGVRASSDADGEIDRTLVQRALKERAGVLSGCRSVLCAPVYTADRQLGALYLTGEPHAASFDEEHRQLITAIGGLAGAAVEQVRRITVLRRDAARLQGDLVLQHSMIGDSPPMRLVYERVSRVARAESTVLIAGETGTGKELAARAIHLNGPRAQRPFVAINCAALAENLLESELFGHERGAFTGAVTQKKGKMELAEGGTLFLDEVGELAPTLQSKLLRALQEREFERLGGTRTVKVIVRVIAATNALLQDEIRKGKFRADLFFRLNVVTIDMPPLRERRSDIPLLARYFLERVAAKAGRRVSGFSAPAMACLVSYSWPGNVRELQNIVERAAVFGSAEEIVREDLPDDLIEARILTSGEATEVDYHGAVLAAKKRVIVEAFQKAGGSYVATARLLHVHPNYLHR